MPESHVKPPVSTVFERADPPSGRFAQDHVRERRVVAAKHSTKAIVEVKRPFSAGKSFTATDTKPNVHPDQAAVSSIRDVRIAIQIGYLIIVARTGGGG